MVTGDILEIFLVFTLCFQTYGGESTGLGLEGEIDNRECAN